MAKITTITNPLTGQPAQVDQLDHTAQQIDDAIARALPGGAIDSVLSSKPNPNLLDNWYFGNPVDQRGGYVVPPGTVIYKDTALTVINTTATTYLKVSYVNETYGLYINANGNNFYVKRSDMIRGYTGVGYGIDRWYLEGGTVSFANGYYEPLVKGVVIQKISAEKALSLVGKTLTVSALTADGLLVSASGIVNPLDQDTKIEARISSSSYVAFRIFANSKSYQIARLVCERNLLAVKTELGSQQTLAHQDENGNWQLNEIPDYGEQLARCQRYFVRMRNVYASGHQANSNIAFVDLVTPVPMRTNPVINVADMGQLSNNQTVARPNSIILAVLIQNHVYLNVNTSENMTFGNAVCLHDADIDLSAEL